MITAKTKAKLIKRVSELKEDEITQEYKYIGENDGGLKCFNMKLAEIVGSDDSDNWDWPKVDNIHLDYTRCILTFDEAKKQVLAELNKINTKVVTK